MKTIILDLNETPYENGKKAGQHFHPLVDHLKETIKDLPKDETFRNKCHSLLLKLKEEYPVYYEEVRGRADGLEVNLDDYFCTLCPELLSKGVEKCTTVIARKENGHYILSHNEDDFWIENNFCISKVKIDDNNWFMTNDMMNMPFGNGISWNSYGILKSINYTHEENFNTDYLPRYFSQRHISEAHSIEDLIDRCKEMKIASGYHVNAIDVNKKIAVSIEVYNDSIDIEYIDDSYVHSNHYIHGDYFNNQRSDEGTNSLFRLKKATELLKNSKRDKESIKKILDYRGPNDSYHDSIFQKPGDYQMTIFNMTFDTENKNEVIVHVVVHDETLTFHYPLEEE